MSKSAKKKPSKTTKVAAAKAAPTAKAPPKLKFCKTLDCSKPAEVRGHCRLHFLKVLRGKGEGTGEPEGKLVAVSNDRRRGNRFQGPDSPGVGDNEAAEKVEALQIDTEDIVSDAEELLKGYGYDDTGS